MYNSLFLWLKITISDSKVSVGYWDFDSDYVDYILDKFADRKVDVLIDSTGGQLASALSISAAFKNHGDVHAYTSYP